MSAIEKSHRDIAARLYLEAVLPAFEELPVVSPRARALIADWDCGVEFAVFGRGGAAVRFNRGKITALPRRVSDAAISLFFLTAAQLVAQFEGKRFTLPLPRRGLWRLASLLRFQRLGKILEAELEHQPRLMLIVALASLRPLSRHDTQSRELLRDCPEGLAEFLAPTIDLAGWAEWRDGAMTWGRGRAPRPADATISFRSASSALAALRGELDEQAAIGMGELTVRGLVPLAETLGLVMARADCYVKRRTKTKQGQWKFI